jgi:hypothetical protein
LRGGALDAVWQEMSDICHSCQDAPAYLIGSYLLIFKPLPPGLHLLTRRVVHAKGGGVRTNTVNLEVLQAQ